jgi:hypothetical protein
LTAYAAFKHCSAYDVSDHDISLSCKIALSHRMGSVEIISDKYEKGMNRLLNFLNAEGR